MMGLCTMWNIICMSFLHLTLSYNVILFPKSIITDVGNNIVTFTCTIQLVTNETTVKHWIVWWKDNIRIVDNDVVLISSSTKYSVYGVSSATRTEYTQMLQVNGIQETDHGMYTCTLLFASYPPGNIQLSLSAQAPIIIRNFISQPSCFTIPSKHETGQQQVMLLCTCSPSDPQITLHWINNMGYLLTSESQVKFTELLTLSHTVSNVSKSSNQLFTCRATSAGSMDTNECVISNQILTTGIVVTQKPSEPVDENSTLITTKTTHKDTSLPQLISNMSSDIQTVTEQKRVDTTANATQEMLISSGDKKTTMIIIIIAVAGVSLITIFIIILLLKNHVKQRKHEENEHPEKGNDNHGNQLISSELGDDQLVDQSFVYRNSVFEIDMNDPMKLYASIDQVNFERSLKHVMNNKKANNIYPLEHNGYKHEPLPPMKAEKINKYKINDKVDASTSPPPQDKGRNTNGDFHLTEENDVYSMCVHMK